MSVGELTRSCVEAIVACTHFDQRRVRSIRHALVIEVCRHCGALRYEGERRWTTPSLVSDLVLVHQAEQSGAAAFRAAAAKAKGEKP